MIRKSILIAMSASLLAGSVFQTASAQPYNGRGNSGPSTDDAYADGYHHGWDDFRTKAPFNDRSAGVNYNYQMAPPPPPSRGPDPRRNDDPDQRWQQQYQRQYSYQDDNYYRECRTKTDPAGVIAGALIGGLLGNALGSGGRRGNSGVATIAGVVLGGALGASLTKSMDCDDRSYAYNTYYTGFNSGRAGVPYQWRNPGNGHYGEFRVNDYYSDPVGFRCANFTQQIYINNRPQAGSGRACQQPDGTWAVVG
jgi:surface antigen